MYLKNFRDLPTLDQRHILKQYSRVVAMGGKGSTIPWALNHYAGA